MCLTITLFKIDYGVCEIEIIIKENQQMKISFKLTKLKMSYSFKEKKKFLEDLAYFLKNDEYGTNV